MGLLQKISPIVVILLLLVLTSNYILDDSNSPTTKASLLILFLGVSLIILGIFQDRFKEFNPIVNLCNIYSGGVLTVVSSVSLAYRTHFFQKWTVFVIIPLIFVLAIIYGMALVGKKKYDAKSND